jgi:hypothetical protein
MEVTIQPRGGTRAAPTVRAGAVTLSWAPALLLWWFEPNRFVSGVRKYFREGSGHLPIGV